MGILLPVRQHFHTKSAPLLFCEYCGENWPCYKWNLHWINPSNVTWIYQNISQWWLGGDCRQHPESHPLTCLCEYDSDRYLMVWCSIHLRVGSQEFLMNSIHKMCSEITLLNQLHHQKSYVSLQHVTWHNIQTQQKTVHIYKYIYISYILSLNIT